MTVPQLSKFVSLVTILTTSQLIFRSAAFVNVYARNAYTMAWRSHGTTNDELVSALKRNGIIQSTAVEQAMRAVDRRHYVVGGNYAYLDQPQPIGFNATISAPHMHAYALGLMEDKLKPGSRSLDVGSGSGYLAACMAIMAGPTGHVVGIDHIKGLVDNSIKNVKNGNPDLLETNRIELHCGDGRQGYESGGPYDAIHVGAAAPTVPQALLDQLKPGGRMVIPVGPEGGHQQLEVYEKDEQGHIKKEAVMGVIYVPLCNQTYQWPGH
eukprot:Colp12_sorted_trinity150504_noHs@4763